MDSYAAESYRDMNAAAGPAAAYACRLRFDRLRKALEGMTMIFLSLRQANRREQSERQC